MDVMDRRMIMGRVLASMGSGIANNIFELVRTIHIETTTNEVVTDALPEGCYIVVTSPHVIKQDGIDANTYVFIAGQFLVYSPSVNTFPGATYLSNRLGQTDYWTMSVAFNDNTTKDKLIIKGNPGGNVIFLAGHDLLIFRVKGD